jgi:CBS domain containing-hemolysin-like protein
MAPWLFTFFLVFANGYFVAAEFALVKLRESQLDVLIKQGNKKALIAKHAKEHLDLYLSACQLGITLTSLALWWIGEETFYKLFEFLITSLGFNISETLLHSLTLPFAFAAITILHIVVGELAPKTMAIRFPMETTLVIVRPLVLFTRIFSPFISLLNWLALKILIIFGVQPASEEEAHSEEELRMIVAESEEEWEITASERELIHNVFEFDDKAVCEVMTNKNKLFAINIEDDQDANIKTIIEEQYSRVPVYEGNEDNLIGWILTKDIFTHIYQKSQFTLRSLLRPLYFVPENQTISALLANLKKMKQHFALVTSEYGTTVGIVTLEDILEELVGDIHDESDDMEKPVTEWDVGVYMINATLAIHEINEYLPFDIPEDEEYTTLAWYLNTVLWRIPVVWDVYETEKYKITVTKKTAQLVEVVKLELV